MNDLKTLNGKEIQFTYVGNLLKVSFKDGGVIPQDLSGFYTSEREATIAVHRYWEKSVPKHRRGSLERNINENPINREASQ
jgi:hypothetical protein